MSPSETLSRAGVRGDLALRMVVTAWRPIGDRRGIRQAAIDHLPQAVDLQHMFRQLHDLSVTAWGLSQPVLVDGYVDPLVRARWSHKSAAKEIERAHRDGDTFVRWMAQKVEEGYLHYDIPGRHDLSPQVRRLTMESPLEVVAVLPGLFLLGKALANFIDLFEKLALTKLRIEARREELLKETAAARLQRTELENQLLELRGGLPDDRAFLVSDAAIVDTEK